MKWEDMLGAIMILHAPGHHHVGVGLTLTYYYATNRITITDASNANKRKFMPANWILA